MEILELYSEILSARFGLLENGSPREPDPGVREAIIGIVYAAHRTEIKELHFVRESLMNRFGREWAINIMENKDACVSSRITEKLVTETPHASLVDAYLGTIAEGYGLPWSPMVPLNARADGNTSPDPKDEVTIQGQTLATEDPEITLGKGLSDDVSEGDVKRTVVQPPAATTSKPSITTPRSTSSAASAPTSSHQPPKDSLPSYSNVAKPDGRRDDDDEDDDLLKRFEALKTRR